MFQEIKISKWPLNHIWVVSKWSPGNFRAIWGHLGPFRGHSKAQISPNINLFFVEGRWRPCDRSCKPVQLFCAIAAPSGFQRSEASGNLEYTRAGHSFLRGVYARMQKGPRPRRLNTMFPIVSQEKQFCFNWFKTNTNEIIVSEQQIKTMKLFRNVFKLF